MIDEEIQNNPQRLAEEKILGQNFDGNVELTPFIQ